MNQVISNKRKSHQGFTSAVMQMFTPPPSSEADISSRLTPEMLLANGGLFFMLAGIFNAIHNPHRHQLKANWRTCTGPGQRDPAQEPQSEG